MPRPKPTFKILSGSLPFPTKPSVKRATVASIIYKNETKEEYVAQVSVCLRILP